MGSTQSSSTVATNDNIIEIKSKQMTNENDNENENSNKIQRPRVVPKNLKGFARVEYKCRKRRAKYDQCYQQKHSAFVVGSKLTDREGEVDDDSCEELFEAYKECVYKGMLKDRQNRGLPMAKPDSALFEFANELEDDDGR